MKTVSKTYQPSSARSPTGRLLPAHLPPLYASGQGERKPKVDEQGWSYDAGYIGHIGARAAEEAQISSLNVNRLKHENSRLHQQQTSTCRAKIHLSISANSGKGANLGFKRKRPKIEQRETKGLSNSTENSPYISEPQITRTICQLEIDDGAYLACIFLLLAKLTV